MNKILLDAYEHEYMTTDITRDQLLQKYALKDQQLPQWQKTIGSTDIIIAPKENLSTASEPNSAVQLVTIEKNEQMIEEINSLKSGIIKYCKDSLRTSDHLEVKEVKDITGILSSLEDSLKPKDKAENTNVVQVTVQNIMNNFKDDC